MRVDGARLWARLQRLARGGAVPEGGIVRPGWGVAHAEACALVAGWIRDGALGVLAALEVVQTLHEQGVEPPRPIAVIGFADEEGNTFEVGVLSAQLWTGELPLDRLEALELRAPDADGLGRLRASVESLGDAGHSERSMPSWAGHDATVLTHTIPVGMLFVPSGGGVSHSPHEWSEPDACAAGAQALLHATLRLAADEGLDRGAP